MISAHSKSLIRLINRSKPDHDNWCLISEKLVKLITSLASKTELVEIKEQNSKTYIRLTNDGQVVSKYLL